jgi:rhamnosyltransferase
MRISVIIPVRGASEKVLRRLVLSLREQTVVPEEILLVETSEGGIPGFRIDLPSVRHLTVRREDFDHGRTRNMAAREALGDVLVFMTQDAEPADRTLIENLTKPLSAPGVRAAYGRQLARPGAKPTERFLRCFNYPEESRVTGAEDIPRLGIKAMFFSNVCSAVRREFWEKAGGFPSGIVLSEDLVLAAELVHRGYRIAYAADAGVYHSHAGSWLRQFRHYFDIGTMLAENAALHRIPPPEGEGRRFLREQIHFLARTGHRRWIPYALFETAMKFAGYLLGRRFAGMPFAWKSAISLNRNYWAQRAKAEAAPLNVPHANGRFPTEGLKGRDIILTGLPRSGTTLTCHLLNKLPDVVALHEPMRVSAFGGFTDKGALIRHIEEYFRDTRRDILERGIVVTKHVGGRVPDNTVPEHRGENGLRKPVGELGEIALNKSLSPNFSLGIKHPAAFSALLGDLVGHFPCYALVRNPLSVLSSWNSIDMSHGRGHSPAAEMLDPALARALAETPDVFDRQLHLLSWFYERYLRFIPMESVLRYESIVATGGRALAAVVPAAESLAEPLKSKNKAYDRDLLRRLADKLLNSEGAYWSFYTRESVQALLEG